MGLCLQKLKKKKLNEEEESIVSEEEAESEFEDIDEDDFYLSSEEEYPIIVPEQVTYVFSPYKTALLGKKKAIHVPPTVNYPFLNDLCTVAYINCNKTMFIMRGVPGSGKSTLVQNLVQKYPKSTVCSADDFFLKDGKYVFDASKLMAAHQACLSKAESACGQKKPIVIIDNTNIRIWEMRKYISIAKSCNYHVVMVTPKTSWKTDANVCAQKNSHDVPVDIIQKKLNDFEEAVPLFYGWFLNEADSSVLLGLRRKYFLECLSKVPEFKEMLTRMISREDAAENWFENYYMISRPRHSQRETASTERSNKYVLHCTAMFCGSSRDLKPGAQNYNRSKHVKEAIGKVCQLLIIGLIITSDTIGARVRFTDKSSLNLYNKPEEKKFDKVFKKKRSGSRQDNSAPALNDDKDNEHFSWASYLGKVKTIYPEKGRTAHITLGFVNEPKDTNRDMLHICHREYCYVAEDKKVDEFDVDGGLLRYYRNGFCAIYFDQPLELNAIFTGQY